MSRRGCLHRFVRIKRLLDRHAPNLDPLQVRRTQTALFAEVRAALGEDPAGERVQALAARWTALVEGFTQRDPALTESVSNAWKDFANWPAEAKQQAQPFADREVRDFMCKALAIRKQPRADG